MQIYSKKKVENLIINELFNQGVEKEQISIPKTIDKLMNTKKKPVYLISFTTENYHTGYETAIELQKILKANNIQAILLPCIKDMEINVAEIKE